MIDVNAKKRDRKKITDAMRSIMDAGQKREDKKITEDESKEWTRLKVEAETLQAEIERDEQMNAYEREEATPPEGTDPIVPDDKRFATFGDQMRAVASAEQGSYDPRLIRAATGQNETNPADGGFAVQSDFQSEILKKKFDVSVLASAAQLIGIGANSNRLVWNSVDSKSRVDGSRWGGVRGYWVAEAGTITASQAELKQTDLKLEKVAALFYSTEELLEDSTAMQNLMNEEVPKELAFQVDTAIFEGSGGGKPLGITNSDAILTVAKRVGQLANTVVYENIQDMWIRVWAKSRGTGSWYINQDIEGELNTMALVVGTGGVPVYLPANGVAGVPFATLMGRPVVPIEQADTLGTVSDINFMDLAQYRLIDKGGIKTANSMHVRFINDEQAFRFTYRINGQPLWDSAMTPFKGTNTVSPFVNLATRA